MKQEATPLWQIIRGAAVVVVGRFFIGWERALNKMSYGYYREPDFRRFGILLIVIGALLTLFGAYRQLREDNRTGRQLGAGFPVGTQMRYDRSHG